MKKKIIEKFWVYAGDDVREEAGKRVAKQLGLDYDHYPTGESLYCEFPYSICITFEFDSNNKATAVGLSIDGDEYDLER